MTKFVQIYDIRMDRTFQVEVADDTIIPPGVPVSPTPWPDVPMLPVTPDEDAD